MITMIKAIFIDFDGNLSDSAVKNCLRGLRHEVANMKILGNYICDGTR